jgi:RHS repeat-associated protein
VLFELGDHLGSSSKVLDKATSELVEASSYLGYGQADSDYRPARWKSFREDYRFTGKEEDSEVGLTYFGKRFLSSALGRWASADPLAVHAIDADPNVYAYVTGELLRAVDPFGLDKFDAQQNRWNEMALSGRGEQVREEQKANAVGAFIALAVVASAVVPGAGGVLRALFGAFVSVEVVTSPTPEEAHEALFGAAVAEGGGMVVSKGLSIASEAVKDTMRAVESDGVKTVLETTAEASQRVEKGRAELKELAKAVPEPAAAPKTKQPTPAPSPPRPKAAAKAENPPCVPCNCFVEGTPVSLCDGSTIGIEDVQVGLSVLSKNDRTGELSCQTVDGISLNQDSHLVELGVVDVDGELETLVGTVEHPFFVDGRWVPMGEISIGTRLWGPGGIAYQVIDVQKYEFSTPTYNFEVHDTHTYFVGGNPVWVHNASGCCAATPPPVPQWNGPVDYTSLKNPKDVSKPKPTPRQVSQMKELNRQQNGGVLRSDLDGEVLQDSGKSMKGQTSPPTNEAQVDHITPVVKGGTRDFSNLQLLSRKQNRAKWDH